MPCCPPFAAAGMGATDAQRLAALFKALADPTRLQLVSMIAAQASGEACVCELVEPAGLSQPTVSHHLRILVEAGFLSREKRGIWAYYSIEPAAFRALAEAVRVDRAGVAAPA